MICNVILFNFFTLSKSSYLILANPNHLMSPLQPPAAYNPMMGATHSHYGQPYGSGHPHAPPPPPMHGLPPTHLSTQPQTNPHMMSAQNGPVILVSNLNEDVS